MNGVPIRVAERLATDVRMLPQKVLEILVTLTNNTLAVSDGFVYPDVYGSGMITHVKDHLTLST